MRLSDSGLGLRVWGYSEQLQIAEMDVFEHRLPVNEFNDQVASCGVLKILWLMFLDHLLCHTLSPKRATLDA